MKLKSEPAYETVQVTDVDIAYPGATESYTLRDGVDTFDEKLLVITFGSGGTIRFNAHRLHWLAVRPRSIRVVVPAAQSATPTSGLPQPSME